MSELPAPQPPSPTPPATPERHAPWTNRSFKLGLLAVAVVVGLLLVIYWGYERHTHSITDDAFIESHIVNIAPEMVTGRIVRFLVEENDTVESGQVLAEIDPVPYLDRVHIARSKLDAATAELTRQEADLKRLRIEVPIQIEIAQSGLAAAESDRFKADESLKLTRDEVEKGIDEARAGVSAGHADQVLAKQEFERFTSLYKQEAVALRKSQEVTRAHDAAQAQVDLAEARLAKALAARKQIDIAEQTLESAKQGARKAGKSVDLAQTGEDQIRVVELLVEVKKLTVEEARRGLEAAQHDLEYTRIRAPFPGIVVKRYRNLGDFASAGVAVLSMYNPELLYAEANLEETRLRGVAPGNPVELRLDAFDRPFKGRVVWINKSTGAQFALMPRNVVAGEFTKVVQRVPVRIWIEKDDRWSQLRAGLSAQVVIALGKGDADWARQAAKKMAQIESQYNQQQR